MGGSTVYKVGLQVELGVTETLLYSGPSHLELIS